MYVAHGDMLGNCDRFMQLIRSSSVFVMAWRTEKDGTHRFGEWAKVK